MKKLLVSLAVIFAMTMIACQKEDTIKPIAPDQDSNPEVPAVDMNVDIVGTWNPTRATEYKILWYSTEDGSLIDSVVSDLSDVGFTFREDGSVSPNPWNLSATYSVDSASIHFNLMGIIKRDYELKALSQDHMAFMRTDTSEYSFGGDPVMGVGIEYWDLSR